MDRWRTIDPWRVLLAGGAASAAYLAANEVDVRLPRSPRRDLPLQGRLLPAFTPVWPLIGLTLHTGLGMPPLATWRCFVQAMLRHAARGAVPRVVHGEAGADGRRGRRGRDR